jgi:hypothetical protein
MSDIFDDIETGEVLLILAAVGIGGYFLWKAYQTVFGPCGPGANGLFCWLVKKNSTETCLKTDPNAKAKAQGGLGGGGNQLTDVEAVSIAILATQDGSIKSISDFVLSPDRTVLQLNNGYVYNSTTFHWFNTAGQDLGKWDGMTPVVKLVPVTTQCSGVCPSLAC